MGGRLSGLPTTLFLPTWKARQRAQSRLTAFQARQTLPKDGELSYNAGKTITEEERSAIIGGTKFLIIYGSTGYRDVFGGPSGLFRSLDNYAAANVGVLPGKWF